MDILSLSLNEAEMDRELMSKPSTLAQKVEIELIKSLSTHNPNMLKILLSGHVSLSSIGSR